MQRSVSPGARKPSAGCTAKGSYAARLKAAARSPTLATEIAAVAQDLAGVAGKVTESGKSSAARRPAVGYGEGLVIGQTL